MILNFKDHKQKVVLNDSLESSVRSSDLDLLHGVPQGSFLGPIFFTLYTYFLNDICHSHNVCFMQINIHKKIYMLYLLQCKVLKNDIIYD